MSSKFKLIQEGFLVLAVFFIFIFNCYAQTAEEYFNRGLADVKQGDLTQAIIDYTKAIEIDPKHAETYDNRGIIYEKQGNVPQAIADYNKAIELNPNYANSYNNRGLTYANQGNYNQAILDYDIK